MTRPEKTALNRRVARACGPCSKAKIVRSFILSNYIEPDMELPQKCSLKTAGSNGMSCINCVRYARIIPEKSWFLLYLFRRNKACMERAAQEQPSTCQKGNVNGRDNKALPLRIFSESTMPERTNSEGDNLYRYEPHSHHNDMRDDSFKTSGPYWVVVENNGNRNTIYRSRYVKACLDSVTDANVGRFQGKRQQGSSQRPSVLTWVQNSGWRGPWI